MIVVEPGSFAVRERVGVDEAALNGEEGEGIEVEARGVVVGGLHDVEVFDADAELAGDVDAGLDGEDLIGSERRERAGARRDGGRVFVDGDADAVARAVVVVAALLPERDSRERVELDAVG